MPQIRLSATSIRDYLTCSQKYRLRYIAGLDPDQDAEALRIGGAWAKMHEHGEEILNKLYTNIPPGYDADEWEAEREMIRRSFLVYRGTYREQLNVIETEGKHEFPLGNPIAGLPVPLKDAVCVVKLDKLIQIPAGIPAVF